MNLRGMKVGRVSTTYTTTTDVTVLQSTAAATSQNVSLPALSQGSGGGIQYFTPNTSAFAPLR